MRLTRRQEASDLKPEDVKPAYRHYFDQAFAKIGGAKALDDIGNPKIASAIADTLFRDGTAKGATNIQRAINIAVPDGVAPDGILGSQSFSTLQEISSSADRSKDFFDALANEREKLHPREKGRIERFRF